MAQLAGICCIKGKERESHGITRGWAFEEITKAEKKMKICQKHEQLECHKTDELSKTAE